MCSCNKGRFVLKHDAYTNKNWGIKILIGYYLIAYFFWQENAVNSKVQSSLLMEKDLYYFSHTIIFPKVIIVPICHFKILYSIPTLKHAPAQKKLNELNLHKYDTANVF